jgi:hypothetical protein
MPAMSADKLETQLTPTPDALPVLEIQGTEPARVVPDNVAERIKQPSVVTKLKILLRSHAVAGREARRRFLVRAALVLLVLLVAGGLGTLAGIGTFWATYDNPHRHAQWYRGPFGEQEYFVRSTKVSRQEYDYYLNTNTNEVAANWAGVGTGLGVGAVLAACGLWLTRWRKAPISPSLEEQITAIVQGHPEAVAAWGGPGVLREPELVEEVLRIEEAGKR